MAPIGTPRQGRARGGDVGSNLDTLRRKRRGPDTAAARFRALARWHVARTGGLGEMSAHRALAVALVTLSTAACSGSLLVRRPERPDVDAALTSAWVLEIRRMARSGDWLLTRSYSLSGDLISMVTGGESLSHASIYDAEHGTIIEAIDPIVREVPLEDLVRRNHVVLVVRPLGTTAANRRASVARARAVIGWPFDGLGLVGLGSPDRFYCSELVVWASRARFATGAVVTPAELLPHGRVVFRSGPRDDPAAARVARLVLQRPGLEVEEHPVAHRP